MTAKIGIIGDIHGEIQRLTELVRIVQNDVDLLVFCGDYVNRGRRSRDVVEFLIALGGKVECIFISGNHDLSFRGALSGKFDDFLRIGGAATVRSYVEPPYDDVESEFVGAVPDHHREFLQDLRPDFRTDGLLVCHDRKPSNSAYLVFGHHPQAQHEPLITPSWAAIDTGCGMTSTGPLTCLIWPDLTWRQSG